MKFALHTSTAISSVLKEPEHFYVDIYYLIIFIHKTRYFSQFFLLFCLIKVITQKRDRKSVV